MTLGSKPKGQQKYNILSDNSFLKKEISDRNWENIMRVLHHTNKHFVKLGNNKMSLDHLSSNA